MSARTSCTPQRTPCSWPSRFERSGLTQLISLRYGTVPDCARNRRIARYGQPYNQFAGTGTGFSFANYNADEMLGTIFYAEQIFYDDREAWDAMAKRGMEADFSWNESAKKYEALYDSLC